MLHYHLLDWGHSVGGGEAEGPSQHHWRPVCAVQSLEAVDTQHSGEVVTLAVSLVLAEVVLVTQPRSVPDTVLDDGGQGDNVTEPEVDSLTRQRMNSMSSVSDEDSPRSNISGRVTKPKRENCSVGNCLHNWWSLFDIILPATIGED